MKLRYIFSLVLSALLFTACSDDDAIEPLGNITLDQSFISIPEGGGDVTMTVKAAAAWQFDKIFEKIDKTTKDTTYTELPTDPAWLTASVLSGPAGETKVVFHADATNGGRETELRISVGGSKQFIVVRQGSLDAADATCKEVMDGPDGKTYRVKGTVTKIANTHYGNWYLNDGTSDVDIYIYGTNDKNGKGGNDPIDGTDGWGFEVGDIVTVEGPKLTYSGTTVELTNVTVVSIEKSLVKVVSEPASIAKNGGDLEVKVAYKGNGAYFTIGDDCKEWVSYKDVKYVPGQVTIFETNPSDTAVFRFNVAANEANTRTGTIKFTSYSGKNSSEVAYTFSQLGGVADVTVAEFLAAEVGDIQYRLTGVITNLYYYKEAVAGFYLRDHTGETMAYQPAGFTGTEAKVGDVVTVVGQRGAYKETPQMANGTLEKVNYTVQALSIADFAALPDDKEAYYLISGTIREATDEEKAAFPAIKNDVATYGNFMLEDASGSVYIYGVLTGWGGAKGKFAELGLTWGDRLTCIAYKTTYNGLIEGVAVYVSSEKQAE